MILRIALILSIAIYSTTNLDAQLPEVLKKDVVESYNWILSVAKSTTCKTNQIVAESDIEETLVDRCQFIDDFKMFPNPTDGKNISVIFKGRKATTKIVITGLDGRVYYEEKNPEFDGFYHKDIDINTIEAGLYIFSVIQGEEIFIRKLVVN